MGILGLRSLLWMVKEFILLAIDQTLDHYRKDKQMNEKDIHQIENGAHGSKGGDVTFFATRRTTTFDPTEGRFVFRVVGSEPEEVMRIDQDGSFWVKGEKVGTDIGIYAGFAKWFGRTGIDLSEARIMTFRAGETEETAQEFLRIEPGPIFYVMGREVVSSGVAIYGGFKEWLGVALTLLGKWPPDA